MDPTISVSKGVFVFKDNEQFKSNKRAREKKDVNASGNIFSDFLWYKSYIKQWKSIEATMQILNEKMFSEVLQNLICFVRDSYKQKTNEIQAAVLLTGINMPDHVAQFKALCQEIRKTVTPHVVTLQSQNCQNVKSFVENVVYGFVNEDSDNDDSDDGNPKRATIRKSQCTISLLQSWYENLYSNKKASKNLVIIVQDFEGFNQEVLQTFILIASSYMNILPFMLIFGVATSLSVLHKSLQYQVSSKINIQVFTSQTPCNYLNNIMENIFFTDLSFHLGGKVFSLFSDIFLFYDLSVTGFMQNVKYAMLEHYSYGNAMALCTSIEYLKGILKKFNNDDCENVRQLMSFRRLVESRSYKERINLLLDDEYFKETLYDEIIKMYDYVNHLHLFIKCLHVLVCDLPKSPLGHQIREIYSLVTTKSIITTVEFKECMQLLRIQSRNEFVENFEKLLAIIGEYLDNNANNNELIEKYFKEMSGLLAKIQVDVFEEEYDDDVDEEIHNDNDTSAIGLKNINRQQLREKLLSMSKSKTLNRYERIRNKLLDYVYNVFEKHLYEPSKNYFHEIFFFNDISIQNHVVGTHRAAIHTALNDPNYYLQCSCCKIPKDTIIHKSMPDISIIYKLHLEYGKMINLFDWLQAFLSIVDPISFDDVDDDDDNKREISAELQARFTQAVAEMEFLGFVKSSKYKTDHVTRLTWGG